jgi:hypothetical protein
MKPVNRLMPTKERKKRELSVHHVQPRSRGGGNNADNLVLWDEVFHDAYHRMFKNLTLPEAMEMLIIVSKGGESWDAARLEDLRSYLRTNRGWQG